MTIIALSAFTDNYIWLLINDKTTNVICVDPGESAPVLEYLTHNNLTLTTILLTHHHYDHCNGVAELSVKFPQVSVFGPRDARLSSVTALNGGETIDCENWQFEVLTTPGHTSTHICYWEKTQAMLFCGDTLFSAGCGRVFDGTMQQLYSSLQKLAQLPPLTKVYCAHEYTEANLRFGQFVEPSNQVINKYLQHLQSNKSKITLPSTIEKELQINPFLRLNQVEVSNFTRQYGSNSLEPFSIFSILRKQKDCFQ